MSFREKLPFAIHECNDPERQRSQLEVITVKGLIAMARFTFDTIAKSNGYLRFLPFYKKCAGF